MQTMPNYIRFYTNNTYQGRELFHAHNGLHYANWIRSGNELRLGDKVFSIVKQISQYCRQQYTTTITGE